MSSSPEQAAITAFPQPGPRPLSRFARRRLCVFHAQNLDSAAVEELLEIDHLLKNSRLIKNSKGTTAGIVQWRNRWIFVKRYNCSNWKRWLRRQIGIPRPFRVVRSTVLLQNIGIPVPELLVAKVVRRGIFSREHAIVNLAYAEPLTAADQILSLLQPDKFRDFALKLATAVNSIHAIEMIHGDLKMQNILLHFSASGEMQVGFFDFDGAMFGKKAVSSRRIAKEWARIISSFSLLNRRAGGNLSDDLIQQEFLKHARISDHGAFKKAITKFYKH